MKFLLLTILSLSAGFSFGQVIVDSCFTSADPGISFDSSVILFDVHHCDLVEWDGSQWVGRVPTSDIIIPPASGEVGCRAFFLGTAAGWTAFGEQVGFLLEEAFQAGETYNFYFTTVSHGELSDGFFAPKLWTNNEPFLDGSVLIGTVDTVGTEWETTQFTFTATEESDGDSILIIGTEGPDVSSGMLGSFCSECVTCERLNEIELGNDTTLCNGDPFLLDATHPNGIYEWQDGNQDALNLADSTGLYWVKVTSEGCSYFVSDTIDVLFLDSIELDLGSDTVVCSEGSIFLGAESESANYQWQDGSESSTLEVTDSGEYWVTVSNACFSAADTIVVEYLLDEDLNLGNDTILCIGSDFVINTGINDAEHLWHDGSVGATFEPAEDGIFWVSVQKGDCIIQDTIQVAFADSVHLNLGADTLFCDSISLTLDASSAIASYFWQDGTQSPTFQVMQPGEYWVNVSNICEFETDTIIISFLESPLVSFGSDTTVCDGNLVNLEVPVQEGLYTWQDGSSAQSYVVENEGTYFLKIENDCGLSSDTIVIFYDSPLDLSIGQDSVVCSFDTLTLTSNIQASNYLWQDGSDQSFILANQTDTYWLSITNACGIYSDTLEISIIDPPSVYLGEDQLLCPGDSLMLEVFADSAQYLWSDFSTESQLTAYYPEVYWVVVTNQCGTAEDFIEFDCEQVTIPNIFTPNGDGFNDALIPFTQGDMVSYQFSVHNRWGKELFRTNDRTQGWNGEDSTGGMYFAVVTFIDYKGDQMNFSQNVMLKKN